MQVVQHSMTELLEAIEGKAPTSQEAPKAAATSAGQRAHYSTRHAKSRGQPAQVQEMDSGVSVMQLELRQSAAGALELSPSYSEVQVR